MSDLDIIQEVETSEENEEEEDDITNERDIGPIFDENTKVELREAYHSIRHKKKKSQKPGENAHASHQGDMWTCTLHSIGKLKLCMSGFPLFIFIRGREISPCSAWTIFKRRGLRRDGGNRPALVGPCRTGPMTRTWRRG